MSVKSRSQILVVSLSNIGDVVLTTPVAASLRVSFPDSEITMVVGPKAQGLLQENSVIDRLVIYNKREKLEGKLKFIKALRKRKYDLVVDLRNTAIPFLVSARKRSPLFRGYRKVNMRERHLEVLAMTGIPVHERAPFDFFNAAESQTLQGKLKNAGVKTDRYVAVSAGAASEKKRWPLNHFANVVGRLLDVYHGHIVLIGDSAERTYVEPLRHIAPGKVHNMAGITTLRELAALIHHSALLLTNDSAAMHLGYELNKNVVAVFGPTDSEKYGQRGERFRVISPGVQVPGDALDCFFGISTGTVFKACRELLSAEASALPAHESL